MVKPAAGSGGPPRISVVLDWFQEVTERVSTPQWLTSVSLPPVQDCVPLVHLLLLCRKE